MNDIVGGIALVEITQIQVAQKGFFERVFSGAKDTTVRVRVLERYGIVDLPDEVDLPATGSHSEKDRFLLYVQAGKIIDSDPVKEARVRTIDPFSLGKESLSNPTFTGPLTMRMAADLWIGKKMPRIDAKDRL